MRAPGSREPSQQQSIACSLVAQKTLHQRERSELDPGWVRQAESETASAGVHMVTPASGTEVHALQVTRTLQL